MGTKGNLAYDLSLFEPREQTQKDPRNSKLRVIKKAREKARQVSIFTVFKAIALSTVIVVSLCCIMINNVKLTELDDAIRKKQTLLSNSQSEAISLNMQLESRASLKSVENTAVNKLGLQKVQNYQITYINLTGGDKVVVASDGQEAIKNTVMRFLHSAVEYFK